MRCDLCERSKTSLNGIYGMETEHLLCSKCFDYIRTRIDENVAEARSHRPGAKKAADGGS